MFFDSCSSKEEAKELYRDLCKLLHPDRGGDSSYFMKMKAEYKGLNYIPISSNPKNFGYKSGGYSSDRFINECKPIYIYKDICVNCETREEYEKKMKDSITSFKARWEDAISQRNAMKNTLEGIKGTWWFKLFGRKFNE